MNMRWNLIMVVVAFFLAFPLTAIFGIECKSVITDVCVFLSIFVVALATYSCSVLTSCWPRLTNEYFDDAVCNIFVLIAMFVFMWILYVLMPDDHDKVFHKSWWLLTTHIGFLVLFAIHALDVWTHVRKSKEK